MHSRHIYVNVSKQINNFLPNTKESVATLHSRFNQCANIFEKYIPTMHWLWSSYPLYQVISLLWWRNGILTQNRNVFSLFLLSVPFPEKILRLKLPQENFTWQWKLQKIEPPVSYLWNRFRTIQTHHVLVAKIKAQCYVCGEYGHWPRDSPHPHTNPSLTNPKANIHPASGPSTIPKSYPTEHKPTSGFKGDAYGNPKSNPIQNGYCT